MAPKMESKEVKKRSRKQAGRNRCVAPLFAPFLGPEGRPGISSDHKQNEEITFPKSKHRGIVSRRFLVPETIWEAPDHANQAKTQYG